MEQEQEPIWYDVQDESKLCRDCKNFKDVCQCRRSRPPRNTEKNHCGRAMTDALRAFEERMKNRRLP